MKCVFLFVVIYLLVPNYLGAQKYLNLDADKYIERFEFLRDDGIDPYYRFQNADLFICNTDTIICLPEVKPLVYLIEDEVTNYLNLLGTKSRIDFIVFSTEKVFVKNVRANFFEDVNSNYLLFFDIRQYMDTRRKYIQMSIFKKGFIHNTTAFVEKPKKYRYLKKKCTKRMD